MTTAIVEPAFFTMPDRTGSYGPEVIDLAKLAGRPLDPEQELAVDAIMSHRLDGSWTALEAAIIQGRQNGKTGGVLLPVALADLFLFDADRIIWTAHLFKTARDAFNDVKAIIEGTAEFSRRVKKITEANGEEGVDLHSGARLEFLARSKGGGRGLYGKRLILDEALFLSAASMGALIPTLSARPNPQIVYGSSAGVGESDHLRNLRDRGRAGDPTLVYLEWGTPKGGCQLGASCSHALGAPGCALDDEEAWLRANPAIHGPRMTLEFIRGERRALPPAEFARERMGWWDDPLGGVQPIDLVAFVACTVADRRKPEGPPGFFLDASPGLRSSSVGVAAADGLPHLELVEHKSGTDWLIERAVELKNRYPRAVWAAEAAGAIGALLPELAEAGIEPKLFTAPDMGRACGHLQRLIIDRAVTILEDPALSMALGGAVSRDMGEGLWTWGRRKSTTDISPLVAITGAAWLHETTTATPPPEVFFF